MKKISLLIVVFGVFFLSIFSSSCDFRKRNSENPVCFDTLQIDTIYHIDNKPELPACNIKIKFIYPQSSDLNNLETVQSFFIEKVLGSTFKNEESKSAVGKFVNHHINNFKFIEENKSEDNSVVEDFDFDLDKEVLPFTYYIQLQDSVTYNKNGFISFLVETVSCEGGAHSLRNISGYVFNLNTKERLTENDFSGDNYNSGVSNLIAVKIAEQNNIKEINDLENLGFYNIEDIKPNDNFTLSKNGITYYFNKNEIAGSMVGIIEVFISYQELSFFLHDGSPISSLIPF